MITSIKTATIMECYDDRAKFDVLAINTVFSYKVLRTYIVTNFLFVEIIFLSAPYIHYKTNET